MKNNQELMKELKIEERMSLGFKHKSIQRVHREYKKCNTLDLKLDYLEKLKADAYDYIYDLDLDSAIRRVKNAMVINY